MSKYIFFFFSFLYTVYGQLPYDVQNIYKPLNSQSVNVMPGDKISAVYKIQDNVNELEKEYSENSLKKLAERYYQEIEEMNENILEELDQINDIVGERSLYFTIF
ncbi:conserved Plasmodium protein, unknown function [Plasmodium malariae]|uniref:Uncharacterized protein n=1 Tax=Plasmodium malariae TaxID=5858 RepID=A0A1D3TEE2_PLAMA|nr:conserved Plasmodium protein, unknown function [Plasmodium malariae]SCP03276.1 conserved Plasmodium protein, unknown function [Plasmodium malariae]